MRAIPDGREGNDLEHRVAELMRPLHSSRGIPLWTEPSVLEIEGDRIPQPSRDLLVHDEGLTPTLEAYWKRSLYLRPLAVRRDGDLLTRQVVLVASEIDRPVGFGAIRMNLDRFEETARSRIVACRTPLGTILREQGVEHKRRLSGFFQVDSDVLAGIGFDVGEHQTLYGRHNVLLSSSDQVMAEVVDILPPSEHDPGTATR